MSCASLRGKHTGQVGCSLKLGTAAQTKIGRRCRGDQCREEAASSRNNPRPIIWASLALTRDLIPSLPINLSSVFSVHTNLEQHPTFRTTIFWTCGRRRLFCAFLLLKCIAAVASNTGESAERTTTSKLLLAAEIQLHVIALHDRPRQRQHLDRILAADRAAILDYDHGPCCPRIPSSAPPRSLIPAAQFNPRRRDGHELPGPAGQHHHQPAAWLVRRDRGS